MLCTQQLENPARSGRKQRYLDCCGAGDYLGSFFYLNRFNLEFYNYAIKKGRLLDLPLYNGSTCLTKPLYAPVKEDDYNKSCYKFLEELPQKDFPY